LNVTRRHVTAALAALPVLGALSGGGLYLRWWDRPHGDALLALSDDEYALVQALAEAWMPPGGVPALSGADADLGRFVDDLVSRMPHPEKELLKVLLQALDDATLPTHLSSFTALPLDERTAVLKGWLNSDIAEERNAVRTVLILIGEGWVMHPDVSAVLADEFACGYGP
jgi:hypothetical protein